MGAATMSTMAMTPPPGGDAQQSPPPTDQSAPAGGAPSPVAAAPAPPQPGTDDGTTRALITAIQTLRAISKAFPKAAPHISQMMEQVPHVMAAVQAQASPGTPAAPPTGS